MSVRTPVLSEPVSNNGFRQILMALTVASAIMLSGCAKIDMPSTLTENPVQLVTEDYSQRYRVADLKAVDYDAMAAHYRSNNDGHPEVIVSYDPYSKKNTAMKASDNLKKITDALSKRGIKNIHGSTLAVDYSGDVSEMMIGYPTLQAQAPENCGMIPGSESNAAVIDPDYKLGCSVKTMIARQVAHPADLAGRSPDTNADGRRTGDAVEDYRSNQLPGLSGGYSSTE